MPHKFHLYLIVIKKLQGSGFNHLFNTEEFDAIRGFKKGLCLYHPQAPLVLCRQDTLSPPYPPLRKVKPARANTIRHSIIAVSKEARLSFVTSFMNVPLPDLSISYKLFFNFLQRTSRHLNFGCNASLEVWRSGKLVCSCKYNCA